MNEISKIATGVLDFKNCAKLILAALVEFWLGL